jgi:hypothetical protein
MYIKYTNTIEDNTKFQLYHNANSPSVKRTCLISRIISSLIFVILAVVGWLDHHIGLASFGVIAAVIAYFYIPYSIIKKTKKLSEKMYKEGKNKGFLCEHTLEIRDNYLIEKTDQGEQSCLLSCVERICLTDEHGFIYVGSIQAHVVPIKRISEGDVDEFIKDLQLKCYQIASP